VTEHKRLVRCAIYTRKSSEEGLEQSFNSLDAQREACQAYILSQRQEGWRTIDTLYDDGGYSGGSIERPALQRLLADVKARKIDAVVVYKVDRLTRSLTDFAKIIEVLDTHHVSFVSITQQFSTTSSMGRLTLNMLLSFAQFEREVTGERIRDKIAASKRKGMWMGGRVPLGYDLKDHRLLVNREEAERVRQIFNLYCRLGCVKRLKAFLDTRGIRSKARTTLSGRRSGGTSFSRGALYHLLRNRIYIGEIPHKKQSYPGDHEPLITPEQWAIVQAKLKENGCARRDPANAAAFSLLKGLLFDDDGNRYTPSHAVKNGRRYRYYTSQAVIKDATNPSDIPGRLPASEIENLVLQKLKSFFASAELVEKELGESNDNLGTTRSLVQAARRFAIEMNSKAGAELGRMVASAVTKVILQTNAIELHLFKHNTRALLLKTAIEETPGEENMLLLTVSAELKRCRGEMRIVSAGDGDQLSAVRIIPALVKAVVRAHQWARLLASGQCKDLQLIADRTGLDHRYVSRILPIAFLVPEMVQTILEGRQHPGTTLEDLLTVASLDWRKQWAELGVPRDKH
jgi:site-specific DNA recombinase